MANHFDRDIVTWLILLIVNFFGFVAALTLIANRLRLKRENAFVNEWD